MLSDLRADLRSALRRSRRAPLLTGAIVLTLTLGIGATTAVYSVVHGVLLKSLPFPEADRVVRLLSLDPERPVDLPSDSWGDVQEWQAQARSFEAIGGYWEGGVTRTFRSPEQTSREPVAVVTPGFDRVLGIRPILGRLFQPEEYQPGGPRSIVLTESFWRREFGGDPAVLGTLIEVADTGRVVVGVISDAASVVTGTGTVAWMPFVALSGNWMASRTSDWIALFGRLRPGIAVARAESEWQTLVRGTDAGAERPRVARVVSLLGRLTAPVRPMLWLLAVAVATALLIACGNVAVLFLAQAESRRQELAVRAALGGGLARLARQFGVEALLTAGVGGVLGVLLARPLVGVFLRFYPGHLVRASDIAIDRPVLVAALLVTSLAALMNGSPLLWRAARLNLGAVLRGGRSSPSPRLGRIRALLACGQLAAAVALVAGGALLVRSFVQMTRIDPGFEPAEVAYVRVTASAVRYPDGARLLAALDQAEAAVRAVPGVDAVAGVSYLPLPETIVGWGTGAVRADDPAKRRLDIQLRHMTPGYPAVMRIPLLRGRDLGSADGPSSAPVALINETMARSAFPGEDPIGKRVIVQGIDWEVVGVLGDMRYWGLTRPVEREVFVPASQAFSPTAPMFFSSRTLVWKSRRPPGTLAPEIRTALRDLDPTLAVGVPERMAARLERARAPERFRALLVGGLGALALLLAALGLYALTAYGVAARTREIGIRMALGATAERIGLQVVRETLGVGLVGVTVGCGLALLEARWLRTFVVEVSPHDPVTLGAVALGFLGLAVVAALVPARRASRVSPGTAMRTE